MKSCLSALFFKNRRSYYLLLVTALLLLMGALILIALSVGSVRIGYGSILAVFKKLAGFHPGPLPEGAGLDQQILLELRLPRIILAILTGAALASAGVIFQGLFRNPLADPYVVGTSSGAALGAALAIAFRLDRAVWGFGALPLLSFAGAFLTTLVVYGLAKVGSRVSLTGFLLAGTVVSAFLTTLTSLIMIFHREEAHQIMFWLMGGLATGRWNDLRLVFPLVAAGFAFALCFSRELNLILLGEEKAFQLGLNTQRLQIQLILCASLLVAAVVSHSGIIGFVGLIVPHVVRFLTGPDHRALLPVSALAGGILLLAADTLARTLLAPLEIPVGIFTVGLGGPFFLYLLRRNKRVAFS